MVLTVAEDERRAQEQRQYRKRVATLSAARIIQDARKLDARLWKPHDEVGEREKSEIAQTLRAMFDEMESKLMGAAKDARYLPVLPGVTFDPKDPLAGSPMAIPPFGMYEWWGTYIKKFTPLVKRHRFSDEVITVPRPKPPAPSKPSQPKWSDEEKKKKAKDYWKKKYGLHGKAAEIFEKGLDIIGYGANAVEFAAEVAGLLGSTVGAAASGLGGIVYVVTAFYQWYKAGRHGHDLYGYLSCGYTITAWAFEQPIPRESREYLYNVRQHAGDISSFREVWAKSSEKALSDLNKFIREKKVKEKHLKVIYQLLHDRSKQKLFRAVMKTFEPRFAGEPKSIRRGFQAIAGFTYPE